MPERVLTKFDDSDPEPATQSPPKKRTAEEAFRTSNTSRKSLVEKSREIPRRTSKVVNFPDKDQNADGVTANRSISSHGRETSSHAGNTGRLKQRASVLLQTRQKLPIWTHAEEIRDKVRKNDALLLVGETGSGKSTQIPQFLLELCHRRVSKDGTKVGGAIAITQPRRVAAISLARRVAEEMGTPLGNSSPASQVGYSVRFDNSTSPSTRVKFLTDGMLLQELIRDPWLKEYSIVVVDEVHERGLNVDLVLGFLKRLIEGRNANDGRGGIPIKVVVMSATADMERIQSFFGSSAAVLNNTVATESDGGRSSNSPSTDRADRVDRAEKSSPADTNVQIKTVSCYIKGRQYPVKIHYVSQPIENTLDTALERIIDIHVHTPLPGDILVFLPGQETIDSLESMCNNYAQTLQAKSKEKGAPRLPKLLILPLFAALPTALQQRVFEPTPVFTRKIILSTNIAETSVTVPGIRHVIDTGKRKARFFRPQLNLDTLLTKPISRSSANQRTGRAGREAPGTCYRLYTEKTFYELTADTEPEILRCDLGQLVLTLKAHNVDNILGFPLLTPPPQKSLERALLHLLQLNALDRWTGEITKLGRQMSTLPLPANLARILLASQLPRYDCLEEMIDIVSGLSVENIWLPIHNQQNINPQPLQQGDDLNGQAEQHQTHMNSDTREDRKEGDSGDDDDDEESQNPIAQARANLFRREGDHLTLLAAIQAYAAENVDRKDWCKRYGISHRAMVGAMDVRKQLRKLMIDGNRYKLQDQKNALANAGEDDNKSRKEKKKQKRKHKRQLKTDGDEMSTSAAEQNGNSDTDIQTEVAAQPSSSTHQDQQNQQEEGLSTRVLKTLLLGLSDNIARISTGPSSTSTSTSTSSSSSATTTSKTTIWTGPYQKISSFSSPSTNQTNVQESRNLSIHPSSILFGRSLPSSFSSSSSKRTGGERNEGGRLPAYIMFNELVVTGKAYVRTVSAVEAKWIDEVLELDF